jgi:hypothetical protein
MKDNNQCVDLSTFEKNLYKIVQHPRIVEHKPTIVFITPPPIDERRQYAIDQVKGFPRRRTAWNTKMYADVVRKVASELKCPVVDIWSKFMEIAGWQPGQPLEGSEDMPPNVALNELLSDGKSILMSFTPVAFFSPENTKADSARYKSLEALVG